MIIIAKRTNICEKNNMDDPNQIFLFVGKFLQS